MEELLNQIPYGVEAMTLLIAIMGLVSAIVRLDGSQAAMEL